jgi:precorrin-6Y C5,15-methyltransferase (decarboxylating)
VSTVDLTAAANRSWKQPALVLSLTDVDVVPAGDWISGGRLVPAGWALPEDDFATRDGKITSTEVRALALAKLAPRLGTLVWDVAAASGAVAVESARLGAAALAVERDPVQCVRILANSSAHGVDVRVVEAELLAAISGLPRPDSIFLGGGGEAVMRACTTVEASRVVVALNSLDRVVPARDALRGAGYKVDGCQLSAARLGDGGKLSAVDPMTLVWGVK